MADKRKKLAKEIIRQALYMKDKGLTPGHSGNISMRYNDFSQENTCKASFLITPTGVPYEELRAKDIVLVNENGVWDQNGLAPSSEWQFHLSAYQANDSVNALVHTHSNFATVLACAGLEIPPFHYMVAAAGVSTIPLVPYAIFGSKELSDGVAKAFKSSSACLLAHHGQLAGGKTLGKAMELAEIIEDLSLQYWSLKQLGEPTLLSKEQMQEVHEKFKSYGQQKAVKSKSARLKLN